MELQEIIPKDKLRKFNNQEKKQAKAQKKIWYQSLGVIEGVLTKQGEKIVITTEAGEIPATIDRKIKWWLDQEENQPKKHKFLGYFRERKSLHFHALTVISENPIWFAKDYRNSNQALLVGTVSKIERKTTENQLTLNMRRNIKPTEKDKEKNQLAWTPFQVKIHLKKDNENWQLYSRLRTGNCIKVRGIIEDKEITAKEIKLLVLKDTSFVPKKLKKTEISRIPSSRSPQIATITLV